MEYRKIGFFKEFWYGDKDGDSLMEAISQNLTYEQKDIIKYLKDGIDIISCGGVDDDIINLSNGIIGSPDTLTDGVWIWSWTLAYYVEKYNISLNDEFILHVKKNNYQVPYMSEIDIEKMAIRLVTHQ